MRNIKNIAKFEYLKVVKKKSFWLSTLFLPAFIAVIAFVSAYSSIDATEQIQDLSSFSHIYVYDEANVLPDSFFVSPLSEVYNLDNADDVLSVDDTVAFVYIPPDFLSSLNYEVYMSKGSGIIKSTMISSVVDSLLKGVATSSIENEESRVMLMSTFSSVVYLYDKDGNLEKSGLESLILPIASLIVFFLSVFISSSYLLQSVSAEKENRMIETMLSIVDKKSLMIGKMLGSVLVIFTQLFIWVVASVCIYFGVMNLLDVNIPIDFSAIDWSPLGLNIFFIFMGYLFFASVMTGVGAIGTGAEDSRNLSSIFILLSVFPLYLVQSLMTQPDSLMSNVFSYFPFTSFMVLLLRNSLGALSTSELVVGIITSIVYVLVALWLSYKMFEIGCLMYNRRPTGKEILSYLRRGD